jgi:D-alanyl-D-alanine carboxypeptidase
MKAAEAPTPVPVQNNAQTFDDGDKVRLLEERIARLERSLAALEKRTIVKDSAHAEPAPVPGAPPETSANLMQTMLTAVDREIEHGDVDSDWSPEQAIWSALQEVGNVQGRGLKCASKACRVDVRVEGPDEITRSVVLANLSTKYPFSAGTAIRRDANDERALTLYIQRPGISLGD